MKTKVLWAPHAREDLLDIYLTIGLDNPNAAERFFTMIEAKADLRLFQYKRYARLRSRPAR